MKKPIKSFVVTEDIYFRDFKPWSGAVDLYDEIIEKGKDGEMEALIEELHPEGLTTTQLNDLLWFEKDWLRERLGLGAEEIESGCHGKGKKKGKKPLKSGRFIKSGPGAGYDVTVKGIELDDGNFKILKDEVFEGYGFHDVTVEVPVKPCVAEYWSAEAYYDAIDSKHDYFDPREDSKIEGGKAVLFFNDVNVDEGETPEDAIERIMPSELNLTMMYGGGWIHTNLPEDGIHFDDDNGRRNLDIGEVYDYETISCDLVCPNICQDINAFFENPEEYYDDYIGSSRKAVKSGFAGKVSLDFGSSAREFPFFDMKGMADEKIDDAINFYDETKTAFGEDGKSYMILEDRSDGERIAVLEDDYESWKDRYFKE